MEINHLLLIKKFMNFGNFKIEDIKKHLLKKYKNNLIN